MDATCLRPAHAIARLRPRVCDNAQEHFVMGILHRVLFSAEMK
jgi:hypothetical protein